MVDIKKIKYFFILIILFILIELICLNHLNNTVLVSGDNEIIEEVKEYKDILDSDTGIELKYELSNEILESDIFKIRDKKLTKKLREEDIVKYFSISIYDKDNIKKRVKNSKVTVTIPLDEELIKYDELNVVRLNSNVEITDDEYLVHVNDNSMVFDINMTSKYGIVGKMKK